MYNMCVITKKNVESITQAHKNVLTLDKIVVSLCTYVLSLNA
jgi:hypothetical protein